MVDMYAVILVFYMTWYHHSNIIRDIPTPSRLPPWLDGTNMVRTWLPSCRIRSGLTESAHYYHSVVAMTSAMSSWWDQQGLPTTTVVSYVVRLTMSFHYYCNVVIILLEPIRLSYVGQTYLDGRAYCTLLPNCSSELIIYFSFTVWCFRVFVVWFVLRNVVVSSF